MFWTSNRQCGEIPRIEKWATTATYTQPWSTTTIHTESTPIYWIRTRFSRRCSLRTTLRTNRSFSVMPLSCHRQQWTFSRRFWALFRNLSQLNLRNWIIVRLLSRRLLTNCEKIPYVRKIHQIKWSCRVHIYPLVNPYLVPTPRQEPWPL